MEWIRPTGTFELEILADRKESRTAAPAAIRLNPASGKWAPLK
jgi:hypothetical protein